MKFQLRTLKSKLFAIVAASFIARVIMFFVLPNTPSSLAPDEGTYGFLSKWVAESKRAGDFPLYGAGLYLSARAVIIPASLFCRIGLDELDAIRLVSSIYGFLSLITVVYLILKIIGINNLSAPLGRYEENLIVALVVVFAFFPSHFIWSNLGLRESPNEFWTLCTFATFYWIFHIRKRLSLLPVLLLIIAIIFVFSSRPQVGWVLGITFLIYLLFNFRDKKALALIPVILIAVVLGLTGVTGTTGTTGTTVTTGTTGTTVGKIGTVAAKSGDLLAAQVKIAAHKHRVNQLDAASVIVTQSCPRDTGLRYTSTPPTSFDTYFCIAWRAPYMSATFLFRPIIGVDITSKSSLFAAVENVAWTGAVIFIIIMLIKKRRLAFFRPLAPSLIFFTIFVVGAGSHEGNMGTAFRHKSLILWVILLLLFATLWGGSQKGNESDGNKLAQKEV